ncbi:MAG TPA: serine hydrolase [Sedimentisphaerales bacterium]|nr:serine hydrolase [Sedimentisphaerales bacterium]
MGIHRSNCAIMAGILLLVSLPTAAQDKQRPPMGPLVVCPQNPRYFQNSATGDVVYLTGSHTWANLANFGPSDPPAPFDSQAYIHWMGGLGHNFMRLWTWELVCWDTKANGEGKRHTSAPHPYVRTGPGMALDGKLKFDLTKSLPSPDVASSKYCLADPGSQYLVFKPADAGDSVEVKAEPGTYRYEWFDPVGGSQVSCGTSCVGEKEARFPCPVQGDAVLFLDRIVFPAADWRRSSPESQGLDSSQLEAAADYLRQNSGSDGVNQLVIVRNGRMVWKGAEIDKVHGVWSMTKSFTSTVLGLLIDDGKATLDTLARDHLPAMAAAYPDVTLRHLTTMTSGYRAIRDEPRGSYRHGPSPAPFDPCSAPLFAPGSQYAYWDSAMNQFGHILTRIADEPMKDLFKRRIADPIGMDPSEWNWGDFGKIDGMTINGGSGNSNKHIFIPARQIARLGYLFLNRGNWNGR